MEVFRDLPKELVEEEILTQVPATYLNGLGSTCKLWNRLFNGDRRFARKHSDKAAKQFLVLMLTRFFRICPAIVDLDGTVPTFEVKTDLSLVDPHSEYPGAQFDINRVFHCDGLLLCTSVDESRFVVWNPFTGFTRWFQPSYRGVTGRYFVLGYGKNKSYKILSYYHTKKDYEIYEFSSDSWRVVDDIMPPGFILGSSSISVPLQGSTYLFSEDQTKTHTIMCLVKFDFSTEECVPVPLPCQSQSNRRLELTGLTNVKDDKLSFLIQRERTSKTEIWLTNKIDETTQVVSWIKVLALDLSPHNDIQLYEDGSFLLDEEKKVVVICDQWFDFEDQTQEQSKDMIYIVGEDNVVTQVDFGLEELPPCLSGILNYVPSLVQLEGPGGNNYVPSLVQLEGPGGKRKRADF